MPDQLICIWDLFPLAPIDSGIYVWFEGRRVIPSKCMKWPSADTTPGGEVGLPSFLEGEYFGLLRYYRPNQVDLAILKRCLAVDICDWLEGADPDCPPWPIIEAELIVAGHKAEELEKMTAPTLLRLLDSVNESSGGQSGVYPPLEAVDEKSHLGPVALARLFGLEKQANAVRKKLERWRRTNHNGWIENTERRPREPQYLYQIGAVRSLLESMK